MAKENEHRYLLPVMPEVGNAKAIPIVQAYLSSDPEKTVRVRRISDEAWLTIKGKKTGGSGDEFEYPIPVTDAVALLGLCPAGNIMDKNRYELAGDDGHIWEVDDFQGKHRGLVIAELELPSMQTPFVKPGWLNGVNITEDFRFANAALSKISREELIDTINSVLKPAGFGTLSL